MSDEKMSTDSFFVRSMDRFSEILAEAKDLASAGDAEKVRERLKELKEMSDGFKGLDSSRLSDNERKFCKYFVRALDRTSDLCSRILDTKDREMSNGASLKLFFGIVKDVSLISRDLNNAKKYMEEEPEEMMR